MGLVWRRAVWRRVGGVSGEGPGAHAALVVLSSSARRQPPAPCCSCTAVPALTSFWSPTGVTLPLLRQSSNLGSGGSFGGGRGLGGGLVGGLGGGLVSGLGVAATLLTVAPPVEVALRQAGGAGW